MAQVQHRTNQFIDIIGQCEDIDNPQLIESTAKRAYKNLSANIDGSVALLCSRTGESHPIDGRKHGTISNCTLEPMLIARFLDLKFEQHVAPFFETSNFRLGMDAKASFFQFRWEIKNILSAYKNKYYVQEPNIPPVQPHPALYVEVDRKHRDDDDADLSIWEETSLTNLSTRTQFKLWGKFTPPLHLGKNYSEILEETYQSV